MILLKSNVCTGLNNSKLHIIILNYYPNYVKVKVHLQTKWSRSMSLMLPFHEMKSTNNDMSDTDTQQAGAYSALHLCYDVYHLADFPWWYKLITSMMHFGIIS